MRLLRGLDTAAAGMSADERMQQLLANNLANMETPGFAASSGEMTMFPEQLLNMSNYGSASNGSPIGKMGTGVGFQEGVPSFVGGSMSQTGRNLDVAIQDNTPPGTYALVSGAAAKPGGATTVAGTRPQSATGVITAAANGRLNIKGASLAVVDAKGQSVPNLYAIKNPAYQGKALYASNGMPDYDAKGNPSYLFANASGTVVGQPGQPNWYGESLRIGSQSDMGDHSFYAVAYQSTQGAGGVALTRNGHLDINSQHVLVDSAGNDILPVGQNGLPVTGAKIVLNANYSGASLFNADGSAVQDAKGQPSYRVVGATGQVVPGARLGTVNADVTQLSPLGESEYMVNSTLNPTVVLANLRQGTGAIKPGELMQSNVDITTTTTQMMEVMNQYEANQRIMQMQDTELGKAVQDVGHVNA